MALGGLWLLAPTFLPSTSTSHDLPIQVSPSHDSPEHMSEYPITWNLRSEN
jgi:hypothetical protein